MKKIAGKVTDIDFFFTEEYLADMPYVYLPRSTSGVYLPRSTYLGLRTKVYLPRSTYLGLPTRSTYSGLLKWIAGYTY